MLNHEIIYLWQASNYEIYLFGTGAYSKALYAYLKVLGISINGFVVTFSDNKVAETGEKIQSVSEFERDVHRPYRLILSIDCKYYNEVMPKLAFAVESLYFLDEQSKESLLKIYQEKHMQANPYDTVFYDENLQRQITDARHIVSAILSCVKPESVIDIGCGVGLIAKTFQIFGVAEVFGVDGDYIDRSTLQLDTEHFIPHDLSEPYFARRRFDLALSLEVAEHLDAQHAAAFVDTLCSLSDIVIFSAAVPYQGGTSHINEKPQSYWARLFEALGYAPIDCIRPLIWENTEVSDYYKQNTILYYKRDTNIKLSVAEYVQQPMLDIIHPDMFKRIVDIWKNKARLGSENETHKNI